MSKIKYISLLFLFIFQTTTIFAADTIKLPIPNTTGGMPLMEVLSKRKTDRNFGNKEIDNKTLSEILWSAMGINRKNGKLTIPTAMNKQNIELYMARADGTWLYNPKKNTLTKVSNENLVKETAAITLIYVSTNGEKINYSALHAGSAYQNVGLYCASVGLNNVVKGSYDKEKLQKVLNLSKDKEILITQTVGWGE